MLPRRSGLRFLVLPQLIKFASGKGRERTIGLLARTSLRWGGPGMPGASRLSLWSSPALFLEFASFSGPWRARSQSASSFCSAVQRRERGVADSPQIAYPAKQTVLARSLACDYGE